VRPHRDLDQGVAGWPAADARLPLAAQAQDLAVARAERNRDLERLALRQGDLPLCSVDCIEEVDLEPIMRVRSAHAESATGLPAEDLGEHVVIGEIGKARAARVGTRAAAVGEVAVIALLRAFLAGSVDLAAVEAGALLGIAQKAVGGRDFLELLLG